MALMSRRMEPIDSESLENWQWVGTGGFGYVYKARHKRWGFNVAIKLPRDGVCTLLPMENALCDEAYRMDTASCDFVLRVYGIYEGTPPVKGLSVQRGMVMQFMDRGSLEALLQRLSDHPPWPLAFRLAHQVALGMNFLHSRNLMHYDLKPSNVLLDDNLKAKLADFGLSRVSTSASSSKKGTTGEVGGTFKYMPPESFEASYEPVRAFDRYSYGIVLWSILTGKEPYPMADSCLVALRIPEGDRPQCDVINLREADGLEELVDLMKMCWDGNPSKRPTFQECFQVTENVFSKHRKEIHVAVHQVLTRLESDTSNQHSNRCETDVFFSQQESVIDSTKTMSDEDKAKFVGDHRAELIQSLSEVMAIVEELGNMVHSETYSVIEAKPTSQEKMRVLYQRTLHSGGVTVRAAFYTVLEKHYPRLLERLGG